MDSDNCIMVNEDQYPHVILRGELADLSALKELDTQSAFLKQRGEPVLAEAPITCRLSLPSGDESVVDQNRIEGEVFVSSSQVLFAAKSSSTDDLAIGATCILMHAMTEEPELSIYLQLQEGDEDTIEVTITPIDSNACQTLFNALCKLVSLHPIDDDDADENDQYFGNDELIWAPSSSHRAFGEDDEDDGATDEERQAMLDRLDSILVVKPEFDMIEGQFDDAEDQFDDAEEDSTSDRLAG
eukprot:scaffold3437_cov113-Cylindrotheca_fusiformis.AAC.14